MDIFYYKNIITNHVVENIPTVFTKGKENKIPDSNLIRPDPTAMHLDALEIDSHQFLEIRAADFASTRKKRHVGQLVSHGFWPLFFFERRR